MSLSAVDPTDASECLVRAACVAHPDRLVSQLNPDRPVHIHPSSGSTLALVYLPLPTSTQMPKRAKETEAPPVNEDGPHVVVYDPQYPMVSGTLYKFKDPDNEGDFLRLPCGSPVVKQCRAHNGGRKLYCVHRKENSKCRWCKELGLGGGTSYCPCGVRRELCIKCKGTSAGISKPAMARKAKAGESSSAAPAAVPAPNQLRLCYFPNRNDRGWILLPDLFTKQGPETIETAFVALKRKADDLERENKRLKTADTLGA